LTGDSVPRRVRMNWFSWNFRGELFFLKRKLCGDSKVMLFGSFAGIIIQNSSTLFAKAGN
jgi:hypothetical protein